MKLADILTWSRILLILPISIFVFLDLRMVVMVLICVAGLTDFFDGYVARKTNTATKAGAELDSRADAIFCIAGIIWLLVLFPDVLRYWPYLIVVLVSIIAELFVTRWKLGKYTGLHLYSQKVSAVPGMLVLPVFLLFGPVYWFLLVAVILGIWGQLEAIIYLLKGGKNLDAKNMFSR